MAKDKTSKEKASEEKAPKEKPAKEKAAKAVKAPKEKNPKKKKPNIFKRIGNYFRDIISEIKKIVWPTPKSTFKNTGIVLIAMVVVGLVIFGLDSGLHYLFGLVMNLAGN